MNPNLKESRSETWTRSAGNLSQRTMVMGKWKSIIADIGIILSEWERKPQLEPTYMYKELQQGNHLGMSTETTTGGLTHCRLNELPHTVYLKSLILILWLLWDLHIPREKWLDCLQTVETLVRRRVLRSLIWVCTVCQLPFERSPDYNGLN